MQDAIQRLVGVVGMQRAQAEVSGFREGDRMLHGFAGANFADEDHVGRLPQGILQRDLVGFRIDAHLPLGDDATGVGMHVFDGVLDGDDMTAGMLVAVLDHRGQGGGFAGAGGADEQHQAPFGHARGR